MLHIKDVKRVLTIHLLEHILIHHGYVASGEIILYSVLGVCFSQAEESYMADEDNQGNTLVSVAPLNPPESQEKPSQNGESLEVVKTQNPLAATNGHSTTKADTEL